MQQNLPSVTVRRSSSGSWEAIHEPSGKSVVGMSETEVTDSMRQILGLSPQGVFGEPPTSPKFTGLSHAIALFLEGPISEALGFHSGWARLESFEDGTAYVRLGGGCDGCPSSQITLFNGVKTQMQSRFGEDVVVDVVPSVNFTAVGTEPGGRRISSRSSGRKRGIDTSRKSSGETIRWQSLLHI